MTAAELAVGALILVGSFLSMAAGIGVLRFPDVLVVCGSVGLSDILADECERLEVVPSPFGVDAGLMGAAALVRYPGWQH